ncbi:hypothetical protein PHLCEN_2v3615 [Hermanssonia centrifuga]|uniref:Uncharacterized protein n=1 Tax=Hermanssonia centrifuga TaxID=98765 RepID=A0A2R6QEJ7_9APHY|nr:hypothetical protein PHLCEN_2v3615 [Hermanssonia centrifuga]
MESSSESASEAMSQSDRVTALEALAGIACLQSPNVPPKNPSRGPQLDNTIVRHTLSGSPSIPSIGPGMRRKTSSRSHGLFAHLVVLTRTNAVVICTSDMV